jgi:hypothetical protein
MADYTISIALRVDDATALWDVAAARAIAVPGFVVEDVLDTIGLREDADVRACLTMILDPSALAGCTVGRFACDPATAEPIRQADVIGLPTRTRQSLATLLQSASAAGRRHSSLG